MLAESVAYLKKRLPQQPSIGIVLGSGLGGLADKIEQSVTIPYQEIPHFSVSTAPSHRGQFVVGTLSGKPVLCMQGRLHFYEGHDISSVIYPIRVMRALGVQSLILTNAAGGINMDFSVGDLMLIEDHINFMGINPLIGANKADLGPRFPDMSHAYSPSLRKTALAVSNEMGIMLRKGVYLACTGPSYETPAEIRAFRTLGADAVGMSTVPEVVAANHCGMDVLAISLITNMAAGVLDQPLSGDEVIAVGSRCGATLQTLVTAIVGRL
ncbi:MAG: purine-nucleoside phosphorylase [Oscillospiraceae bacterium]